MVASSLPKVSSSENLAADNPLAIISMPSPEGPGAAVSVDYFAPLPVMPRGTPAPCSSPIVSAAEPTCSESLQPNFTAEGKANILTNRYTPLCRGPCSILSENGLRFCSKRSHTVYKLLEVWKITTSSYHPNSNGAMERVNDTMSQMLAKVVNELQNY